MLASPDFMSPAVGEANSSETLWGLPARFLPYVGLVEDAEDVGGHGGGRGGLHRRQWLGSERARVSS
jgi:hypothetical protein